MKVNYRFSWDVSIDIETLIGTQQQVEQVIGTLNIEEARIIHEHWPWDEEQYISPRETLRWDEVKFAMSSRHQLYNVSIIELMPTWENGKMHTHVFTSVLFAKLWDQSDTSEQNDWFYCFSQSFLLFQIISTSTFIK